MAPIHCHANELEKNTKICAAIGEEKKLYKIFLLIFLKMVVGIWPKFSWKSKKTKLCVVVPLC